MPTYIMLMPCNISPTINDYCVFLLMQKESNFYSISKALVQKNNQQLYHEVYKFSKQSRMLPRFENSAIMSNNLFSKIILE